MRILIEEYQYDAAKVKDVLHGIDALENVEGKVSIHYVGYYYNALLKDCVFILPKVLLKNVNKDVNRKELAFGKYKPEEIVWIDKPLEKGIPEKDFLYKFAVWIYRAIVVYKNDKRNQTSIVYHSKKAEIGKGNRRMSNTYLDILLQLLQFNHDNQNFFLFIVKNMHSGYNKINWTRTISQKKAFIQNGDPIYLNPVNKKRQINFDEELLVIFFSILNYIGDTYGFPKEIRFQFQLITGAQFNTYIKGYGVTRLRQIKYKYFSDKALELWNLCYAFFDETRQVSINTEKKEYLLAKNFNIVFESIIDELIGDKVLPDNMEKEQEDGKIIDHLFTAQSLIENESTHRQTYYIGDSKYYKMGHNIGKESIYKQYTYARNVIQWNLDIFNDGKEPTSGVKLRDDVTEGYNIIPNFFLSAKIDETLSYENDGIEKTDRSKNHHRKEQFKNRLFDRDTLLLFHYDVNFLYVLSLYARNNALKKKDWKCKIRDKFRNEIQEWLQKDFDFYAMTPREGVNAEEFLKNNFQQLLGKVFTPYKTEEPQPYYSLALDKGEEFTNENELLLTLLKPAFYCKKCALGKNPADLLPKVTQNAGKAEISPSYFTVHHVERYLKQHFLIGCYHSEEQYAWIMGKNDKGTNLYNVRLKRRGTEEREGALSPSFLEGVDVKFVILYKFGEESKNTYRVFHVHHHATMDEERMRKALYPNPKGNYFCFVFDEEVQLSSKINLSDLIKAEKPNSNDGVPIFKTGEQLLDFVIQA